MQNETNHLGQAIGCLVDRWQAVPHPKHQIMVGVHCTLSPIDIEHDAAALYDAYTLDVDGKMWTYLAFGPFPSRNDFQHWLNHACTHADPLFFTIKQQNKPVGVAAFMRIDKDNGVLEIGNLAFSPDLQQTTAATEAIFLMLSHAFDLGYRRVEWKCNALNAPSMRAALRFGFAYEGTFKQAVVVKGRNRDTAWYAMLDADWPRIKSGYQQWLHQDNFDGEGKQKQMLTSFINIAA